MLLISFCAFILHLRTDIRYFAISDIYLNGGSARSGHLSSHSDYDFFLFALLCVFAGRLCRVGPSYVIDILCRVGPSYVIDIDELSSQK